MDNILILLKSIKKLHRKIRDKELAKRGAALGICCHPYDVCTELIARELGIIVISEDRFVPNCRRIIS